MIGFKRLRSIVKKTPSKIVLFVIDGLGGLPKLGIGKTELETASTPNLDRLAKESVCGLIDPVSPGITPGSGPAHLALFGYDPLNFLIGRGVLEALGIDFELKEGDVAARGNFCTVSQEGLIADRRAGRISTEHCAELCRLLSKIDLKDTQLFVAPVREHRFVVVFRGQGLSAELTDSDPQQSGVPSKNVTPLSLKATRAADLVNKFISKAKEALAHSQPANMVLLRGFSKSPLLPSMSEVYKLNSAAIAVYPMYRGLAKLVGMEVLTTGSTFADELDTLAKHRDKHDFFYLHVKQTDSAGEDSDFDRKVQIIEEIDSLLPRLLNLELDVLIVTGDHSTPAVLRSHSWHPVPLLLFSRWCRPDGVEEFSEKGCISGALGRFPATEVMILALANALKLEKFGA